jgi:hypothetical protein
LRRIDRFVAAAGLALALAGGLAGAQARDLVRFEELEDEDVLAQAFRVTRPLKLHVVCEGAGDGAADEMFAYGWILDAASREVVWSLTPSGAKSEGRNYVFEGDVALRPGDYIAYYAAYGTWRQKIKIIRILGKEIGRIQVDNDRRKRLPRDYRRWGLRISTLSAADDRSVVDLGERAPADSRRIVQLIGLGDGDFEQRAFTLPRPTRVTIYCLGEHDQGNDSMADLGWILNAETRQRVWEMEPDNSEHAGGAAKNRVSRQTVALPAGSYIVYYSCDDSHSTGAWNAPPPYDPDFWGITLWAPTAEEARRVQPYQDDEPARTLVSLLEQPDGAYVTQGLTLLRPMRVRVYALGESAHGEFADMGWIDDLRTHRRVWEMREDNTRHAGGARKNRVADEVLELAAGDYVVGYTSDDSHSYHDWNAAPPRDPSHWGITLTGVGREFDRSSFRLFDAEAREEAGRQDLVRLVRSRDEVHRKQRFQLDRPTRLHIVALGEGLGKEMYDYGWIENERGEVVWEMTGRNTRHAGGAEKNRIYDGVILLDKGHYEAHYVTDGSHSWAGWNAPRPPSPQLWGLTITVSEDSR